jgi:hypothetical protein
MERSQIRWCLALAHVALFFGVTVTVWRVRGPDVMLHEAILWYGGCGLFLWQLLPFGMPTQLTIEIVVAVLLVVLAVQAVRGKRSFIVAGNAMLAFLCLFPFVISTFGRYIGP